jgi:hypothetical protein
MGRNKEKTSDRDRERDTVRDTERGGERKGTCTHILTMGEIFLLHKK